jgi:hypothetical protein
VESFCPLILELKMLLSEAIDYVSYFMDTKKADGAFAEAWNIIFKKLMEGQKPSTNKASAPGCKRCGGRVTHGGYCASCHESYYP